MPLTFAPHPPALVGNALRVARGPHPIRVSGPAKALCDMVASLAEQAMVAPPPNADELIAVYDPPIYKT